MFSGIYKLADHIIEINSIYDEVQQLCKDYQSQSVPEITVSTTLEDIDRERQESAESREFEGLPPYEFSPSYLETLAVYRQIVEKLIPLDIILFHGSAIAVDGECYLFTAKSGTGKSTHTRLWRKLLGEKAVMINDDKPLIKILPASTEDSKSPIIFGTPWDGKHHLSTNTSAHLKAICILTRDVTNHIAEIGPKDAFDMLLQQSHQPDDPILVLQYLELINRLGSQVKFYKLGCNMDPEAALVAYNGMKD